MTGVGVVNDGPGDAAVGVDMAVIDGVSGTAEHPFHARIEPDQAVFVWAVS